MKNAAQLQLEVVIIKIRRETKNSKEIVLVGLELCREHLQVMVYGSGMNDHMNPPPGALMSWEGHRAGQGRFKTPVIFQSVRQ